jgi:RHS repeat-associated protein
MSWLGAAVCALLFICGWVESSRAETACLGEVEWQESYMADRLRCGRPGFLSKTVYYFAEEHKQTIWKTVPGKGTAIHITKHKISYLGGLTNRCPVETSFCDVGSSNYTGITIPFDAEADLLATAGGHCDRVFPLAGGCDCEEGTDVEEERNCDTSAGCGNLCLTAFNQLLMLCCDEANNFYPPTIASQTSNDAVQTNTRQVSDISTTYEHGRGIMRVRQEVELTEPTTIGELATKVLEAAKRSGWWDGRFFLNSLIPDGELQCVAGSLLRYRIKIKSEVGVRYTAKWNLLLTQHSPTKSRNLIRDLTWSAIGNGGDLYSPYFQLPLPSLYEISDGEVVDLEVHGETPCVGDACLPQEDMPGDGPDLLQSASFLISLGAGSPQGVAGLISFHQESPTPTMSTPESLHFNFDANVVTMVTNLDGSMHLAAPLVLARIEMVDRFAYWIHCSARLPDGSYQTNAPFVSHLVRNPHGDTRLDTLQHIRIRPGSSVTNEFVFEGSGQTQSWRLITGNGLRGERLIKTAHAGGTRLESYRIFAPATLTEIYRRDELFRQTLSGDQLLSRVIDPLGLALTLTNSYDPLGRLLLRVHPDGAWERFSYDEIGRVAKRCEPFGHQPPTAPESDCRVTEYVYESIPGSPDDATIRISEPRLSRQKIRGHVVSEKMRAYEGAYRILTRVAASPGAAWNDPKNESSWTEFDGDRRPVLSVEVNGTRQRIRRFAQETGLLVVTTLLDATGIEYERKDEKFDRLGRPVYRRVYDVASGALTKEEVFSEPDRFLRPTRIDYLDGSREFTMREDCCRISRRTDREGVTSLYQYDALLRPIAVTRQGTTISNVFDAAGRLLAVYRLGTSGRPVRKQAFVYDAAGRVVQEVNALGGVTQFAYGVDEAGRRVTAVLYPDGGTRREVRGRDRELLAVTGSAVRPVRYVSGVTNDGAQMRSSVLEIKLDAAGQDTPEQLVHINDAQNRRIKTLYPGNGAPFHQSFYNAKGQLWKKRDADGVVTLYEYNSRGDLEIVCLDVDRNDEVNREGTDRITQTVTDLVAGHETMVHRTRTLVWTMDNNPTPSLVETLETSVDGLKWWRDQGGAIWSSTRTIPRNDVSTVTEAQPHGALKVYLHRVGQLVAVAEYDSNGVQIARMTLGYDGEGRPNTLIDARSGTTRYSYNAADQVIGIAAPSSGRPEDKPQSIQLEYDRMGRITRRVHADGSQLEQWYSAKGEVVARRGATLPVGYRYDAQGRLTHMTNWSAADQAWTTRITEWIYDSQRGWLIQKRYADQPGPSYEYSAAGRLLRRRSARGVTASYEHGPGGEVKRIGYDDNGATPPLSSTYDRRGQVIAVGQGAHAWTFADDLRGERLSEQCVSGPTAGLLLTNRIDAAGRLLSVELVDGGNRWASHQYSYDPAGRLGAVQAGELTVRYSYSPSSRMADQLTWQHNGITRMTSRREFDALNRLRSISTETGGGENASGTPSPVAMQQYTLNLANQRTRMTSGDGSFWTFEHDALGQVRAGRRFWSDWTPVAGQQFEYQYDDCGNRTWSRRGGDENGMGLRTSSQVFNLQNQLTRRNVPSSLDIVGAATATAAEIRVNEVLASRRGEYFRAELNLDNTSGPVWSQVTTRAVLHGQTNRQQGFVYHPPALETYLYDADGNLLQDGRWNYFWDAENRLVKMESRESLPAAARRQLEFSYDLLGRRVRKAVSRWTGTAWQPVLDERYVHHGNNLVAVWDAVNRRATKTFLWGSDLSDTLNGAGGVGGLLAMLVDGVPACVATDGNGNVTALVDAATGRVEAQYEYGPFGEMLRCTGPKANTNPFRFSTKFQDEETDLYYYGHRYYCSQVGRWLSRDPLGEAGGMGLYLFAGNRPTDSIDPLGLSEWRPKLISGLPVNSLTIKGTGHTILPPFYWFFMSSSAYPSDDKLDSRSHVSGSVFKGLWGTFGTAKADVITDIRCLDDGQIIASSKGASLDTDGPVQALIELSVQNLDKHSLAISVVASGALEASGGPSTGLGGKPGPTLQISWPDAKAAATQQLGTFVWKCVCGSSD